MTTLQIEKVFDYLKLCTEKDRDSILMQGRYYHPEKQMIIETWVSGDTKSDSNPNISGEDGL